MTEIIWKSKFKIKKLPRGTVIDEKKVIDEKTFAKKFSNFGPSTLVGQRPMESLLSVCLSVRLSVRPPSVTKFSQDWIIIFFWYYTWW